MWMPVAAFRVYPKGVIDNKVIALAAEPKGHAAHYVHDFWRLVTN